MLAQHGFDAYGLEISDTAIATAKAYSGPEMEAPSAYNFSTRHYEPRETVGQVAFMQGDFFQRDWEQATALTGAAKFDLIYDYTVSSVHYQPRYYISNIPSSYVHFCRRGERTGQHVWATYLSLMGCLFVSNFRSIRILAFLDRHGV